MSREVVAYTSRYERELLQSARVFALRAGVTVKVVLNSALAEYLARREQTGAGAIPNLQYGRGQPSRAVRAPQAQLLHVDPRGRRVRRRPVAD